MQRQSIITQRDIELFKILSSGPATVKQIQGALCEVRDKEQHSKNYKITDGALSVRLHKLKKSRFLQSRRYHSWDGSGVFSLYALTLQSIEVLKIKCDINPRYVRSALPNRFTVSHELEVVAVVNAIKKDAEKYSYSVGIEDENALKGDSEGVKKDMPYPDLFVTLALRVDRQKVVRRFSVEIDNSTIPCKDVVSKTSNLYKTRGQIVLLLCTVLSRIERLKEEFLSYIAKSDEDKEIDLCKRVFFALQSDFTAKGFLETEWITSDGSRGVMVSQKKQ